MQMAPPRHPRNTVTLKMTKGMKGKKYSSELYLASLQPTILFSVRTFIEMLYLQSSHSIP